MAPLRQRVELETPLPVDEVRRRLAAATAAWAGGPFGRPVPAPPWPADRFVGCERTEERWLALPVVVSGTVRPLGAGARLVAVIRPHAWAAAPYGLVAAVLAGPALLGGAPLFGALWLLLVAAAASHNLSARVSERAAAMHGLLAEASGASGAAERAP